MVDEVLLQQALDSAKTKIPEKEITKEINHCDNLIKQALNIETKDLINQIEEKRATIKQKTSELIEQMESIIIMETTKNSGPK